VAQYINNSEVHHNFHTPVSQQAALELLLFNQITLQVQLNQQDKDVWTYIWGTTKYASSKLYALNFHSIEPPSLFRWIWKSKVTKKIKIFIWLLFIDRINSRNLLRRKNYKIDGDDYSCVLCNLDIEEFSYHLIFQCPFSTECWSFLGIHWDQDLYFLETIKKDKQDSHLEHFMEIFSIAAWEICKQRNGLIFRGTIPTFHSWKDNFLTTVKHQMYRLTQENGLSLQNWLSTLA
jgi:hypothetical protein